MSDLTLRQMNRNANIMIGDISDELGGIIQGLQAELDALKAENATLRRLVNAIVDNSGVDTEYNAPAYFAAIDGYRSYREQKSPAEPSGNPGELDERQENPDE